jgi:hypothetical protein
LNRRFNELEEKNKRLEEKLNQLFVSPSEKTDLQSETKTSATLDKNIDC